MSNPLDLKSLDPSIRNRLDTLLRLMSSGVKKDCVLNSYRYMLKGCSESEIKETLKKDLKFLIKEKSK